ncbi:response regulator transcription factor [Demequina zhanjiangensis]|uniref:Response regulator transcription factor n=1 Tax=Demequina zhanjiangensis TaxID=3051659 RepID=A0ABT8G2Y8_9MICO|nr:response regulator transcription factor [Demequina sp. SYSU T00b26]MDN4473059.1 response regulator transcription factor [Demequina sp. SYSU T00b26]
MTLSVLFADDHALLRTTYRLLVEAVDDMTVAGEAETGWQAVSLCRETHPDVVVMDLEMPEMGGVAATEAIKSDPDLHHTAVLVLTTFETEELVLAALQAGASGFLGKGAQPAELLDAIRAVARGDQPLSPAATRTLIARVAAGEIDRTLRTIPGMDDLTEREREVTAMVARGLSNDEIGARLFISPATVKTHVNRAMLKVQARDRAQLVAFAYEAGIVR